VDTDRWQRAKDLFGSALEREPGQRNAFLAEACRGDETLRQEIESLLAAHEEAGTTAGAIAADSLSGRRIGPYQLIHRIGQGGMAMVYLATRADDQYRKRVAIKLILPGLHTDELLRRFRNERQTLAALDHPNIVRLLDGGETEDRLPYLVMDYVEGTPITDYCHARRLSTAERLLLFRTVCGAISYAHQRLVIHRDLKPGNLLVTADGTPKLLDFGIAKLLNPEAGATLVVTRTGQRLMTPHYASPEQVRGEPLTNSTDVYSLGVVLYELLTGHRPHRFKAQSPLEIERAICEEEPVKPSTAVTRSHEHTTADGTSIVATPEAVSRTREGDPKKLSSRLHGDLDAIVMMALRKEPQRRYSSVYEFSEDIRRHLEGLPVKARPSTIIYRGTKFLHRYKGATVALFVALVSALVIGGLLYTRHAHRLTEKDTVVLADFTNSTGDHVFDDTLKQALSVELEQSPFLNLLSDRKVSATLKFMGRGPNDHVSREVAREICIRNGSRAVLAGSLSTLGNEYVVELEAVACDTGDSLAKAQAEATAKEAILRALHKAASSLRTKLGESLVSLQKFDVPNEATTSSLEALKNYSMGIAVGHEKGDAPSIPFLKRAIELDPGFALAYSGLGMSYHNLSEPSLAAENLRKAYELRDRVSEREKYQISAYYYTIVTGEVERAIQTYEAWEHTYPQNVAPRSNLGMVYAALGQWDKAAEQREDALRLDPNNLVAYQALAFCYLALDRLSDAQATLERAQRRKLDGPLLRQDAYFLAFLNGDMPKMEQQVAWAVGRPGAEDMLLSMQSDTEAYYGRLAQAREFSRRAVESAKRAGFKETASLWQVNAALREAEFGNTAVAKQEVTKALELSRDRDVSVVSGLTLARSGDPVGAKTIMLALEKNQPSNTVLNVYWLPLVKATTALNRGSASQALALLESAKPYELSDAGGFINNLYPAYVRGQAYLQAHNGTQAIAEFQKLLDHRGIVGNFPTGALAHLQIGRACAMSGEISRAKSAYEDFFAIWTNADPDIRILRQAKAEYAKLR
jgi:serine/threonine protein kinase/tetratricopeptide (TPR) repeat protein